MVQLVDSFNSHSSVTKSLTGVQPESESASKFPVKLEIEDSLDEEHGPLNKKSKFPPPFQQQWSSGSSCISSQPEYYDPLAEPSPLGLRLRKSPSLLDLIQMRLSQGDAHAATTGVEKSDNLDLGKKKESRCVVASAGTDKLKASNFPASILRIGTWECISRYEGDLVAKCYFAKHKLVWEVLDGGLKSKIEIQWSDITSLKANCPDDVPGTLDIVLARQPLFFRETNPQPRKHTLWQATSDFTGGQATIHRRHFLQCPQGLLGKHFEKLIQCDPRLNLLSRRPEIILENPYFESRGSVFEDQDEPKCHDFNQLKNDFASTFSGFHDAASSCAVQASVGRVMDPVSLETPSPSSVIDSRATEDTGSSGNEELKELRQLDHQFKLHGLSSSISVSNLVNHIGICISEQMNSGKPLFPGEGSWNRGMFDELTQHLLSDSQFSLSDEKSLMSRVNSLCCLLQKDGSQVVINKEEDRLRVEDERYEKLDLVPDMAHEEGNCASGRKQMPTMSRKDSLGDFLLHLPRIASLPQFLFNASDDVGNRAR